MDNEVWSKLVNAARDAEIELRKVSFDTMRPPIPVATYNRLVAQAYSRIMALEDSVKRLEVKAGIVPTAGSSQLESPVTGVFAPPKETKSASAK